MTDWVPLSHNHVREGLSEIRPIIGGGGFAFTKLVCAEQDPKIMHLGNKLQECVHLRHVVLSNNEITDITAVSKLSHLLKLQVDNNAINSIDCLKENCPNLPWCQHIDLSTNKITVLPSLSSLVRLRFLKLEANNIASLELGGHDALEELELQGNDLESLKGLGCCKNLKKLDVSGQKGENKFISLEGLDAPVLTQLIASGNALATLAHIGGAPVCEDLDVKNNSLAAPDEDATMPIEFEELGKALPALRSVSLDGNPVGALRLELLLAVPQLTKADEQEFTEEERKQAQERGEEIRVANELRAQKAAEEAEAARLAAEEEAAAAAAAAAAEAEAAAEVPG